MINQLLLSAFEGYCVSTGTLRIHIPGLGPKSKDPDNPTYTSLFKIGLCMLGGIVGYYVANALGFQYGISQFAC